MTDPVKNRIIIALDVDALGRARDLVALLKNDVGSFKIGKQLFTHYGPEAVHMVHDHGGKVFLDLKFHDIPTTVAKASLEAAHHGIFMFNMHALGGLEMMRRAADAVHRWAADSGCPRPTILAVTILTSMADADLKLLGIADTTQNLVIRLALLAREAGLDGVVASPRETLPIRKACGSGFVIVTPGIRPAYAAKNDQKRSMTPAEALSQGSDYIVVGRPVTQAPDPLTAVQQLSAEIETC